MAPFIEFVHVLCGVTFFGITIASFVYITSSIKQKNASLLHYALQTSLLGDCIIFPVIVIQFLTGTFMVHHHHLSFSTPWIIVAYYAFSAASLIWFLLALIKYSNYSGTKTKNNFHYQKFFIILNVILILLFCMIVHDAVTQQTWLWR